MSEDLFLKYLRKDLKPYVKESDCCEDIVELRKEIERLQAELDKEYRISRAMKYIEKHNEIWNYEERFRKIKKYLKSIRADNQKGILSSYNLIEDNIIRLCDGLDILGSDKE